jgi:hypothetical protein
VAATNVSTVTVPRATGTNGLTAIAAIVIETSEVIVATVSAAIVTEIAGVAISGVIVIGLKHRAPSRLVEKLRVKILLSP